MTVSEEITAVIDCVRSGDTDAAVRRAAGLPLDELHQAILGEAFDHQSLECYALYVGLLLDGESAARHAAASELMSLALNVIPGAYRTAFFHAVRAVALAPDDVLFKEHVLSFHNNPEGLLSRDQARRVAQEILDADPSNDTGRQVLGIADEPEST